ncbi:MAG: nodulation protein NfeD, partial [Proteobacteria bacterium]
MMPLDQNVLHFLSSPDLFYLFFVAGLLGIALEFLHPGMLIPGILGAFSLIIAFV